MDSRTPPDARHFERLRRTCLGSPIARRHGYTIEIDAPGRARVVIPFDPDLTQNTGRLHGAVLFEAADTAGFVAANSVEATYGVLTVDYQISFVRSALAGGVTAVAQVLHAGRTLIRAESRVLDEAGDLLALGHGTYLVTRVPLAEVPGYLEP